MADQISVYLTQKSDLSTPKPLPLMFIHLFTEQIFIGSNWWAPGWMLLLTLCRSSCIFHIFSFSFTPWDLADCLLFQIPELGYWRSTIVLFNSISSNLVSSYHPILVSFLWIIHSSCPYRVQCSDPRALIQNLIDQCRPKQPVAASLWAVYP